MLLSLFCAPALAATLTVEADGSGDYASINLALSNAQDGDTIVVGSGTFAEALVVGGASVSIVGSGAGDTALDASGRYTAISTSGGALHIEGMTIYNSGSRALVAYGGSVSFTDVLIEDAGSASLSGGVLYADGALVSFTDSTIDGGDGYGGAVYLNNGAQLIGSGCTITGTETVYGGIIAYNNSTVLLDGCSLSQMYAASHGAAVYLGARSSLDATDTTFYGNLTGYGHGSAVYANDSTVTLSGSTFELNYCTNYTEGYSGGALFLEGSSAVIEGTEFANNQAYYGGAIRVYNGSSVALSGATFDGNYAHYGGAVYADYTSTAGDVDGEYVGNTSTYSGGALYGSSGVAFDLDDTSFIENGALYGDGGAIYAYAGETRVSGAIFEDNTAYYGGGALYANYNYASYPTVIEDSTFEGNTSTYRYGGAVCGYASHLEISGTTFTSNEVTGTHGGAVGVYYAGADIRESTFTNNRAVAGMGGAIYGYYSPGSSDQLVIADSDFVSNAAQHHGGALASVYDNLTVTGSRFLVNDTEGAGMGGALFVSSPAAATVSRNLLFGNNAGYGGGIYADASGVVGQWRNNLFVENTAGTGGAGVWVDASAAVINNTFVNNSAVDAAGNIALVNSAAQITNNALAWSAAGEALYAYDEASAEGSQFSYNAYFEITDGLLGGELTDKLGMGEGSLPGTEPGFAAYSADGNADNDRFVLLRDSPLVDAGDPNILDIDGSTSDIGAWGGPGVIPEDADGDGFESWLDCDDTDPAAHPGATETWYDGVNADCLSGSDFDADQDGADLEDDCDDTDAAIQTGCDEGGDTGMVPDEDADKPGSEAATPGKAGCVTVSGAGWGWLVGALVLGWRRRR